MDKQQETKLSLAEEISSDLLLELFEEGLNKHELIFIDYALYFTEVTIKILKEKSGTEPTIEDFFAYITTIGNSEQQKLANKIYGMLKNRTEWTKHKKGFTELESLLWQYEISRNPWKDASRKAKELNNIKYESNNKLKSKILELWNARPNKQSFKKFDAINYETINNFIKTTCPDFKCKDLHAYVANTIHRRKK